MHTKLLKFFSCCVLMLGLFACAPGPLPADDEVGPAAAPLGVQAVAIAASPTTVAPGGAVTINVTEDPGNRLDWVGLYRSGTDDQALIDWYYLNGSKTPPAMGSATAMFSFPVPVSAGTGTFNFRLFANDGYTKLATSNNVTVQSAAMTTIVASPAAVAPGGTVTAAVTNSPGNRLDWIAVLLAGSGDEGVIDWFYLNGSKTAPATGLTSAMVPFIMPMATGLYNFRLFANDGYNKLATSNNVSVQSAPTPMVTVTPTTVMPGGTVTVTIANGPANRLDWVTLNRAAEDDRIILDWKYLNGSRMAPAMGQSGATLTFTMPTTPGSYNIRFFANDGFTKLAQSAAVTVQ